MTTYKVKNQNLESNFKLNFTQPTTQILREYHPLNYNLNKQNLSIDSRILPLFRTPLLRKKSEEIQVDINKYNLNIQNNLNHNFSHQILKFFLKGITLYNLNLKNFLLQGNKLNLILNIQNDKLYELNTRISNFFQRVNKLIFELNEKTVSSKTNNSKKTLIKKSDTLFARPVNNDLYNYPNLLGRSISKEYGFRKLLIIHKISTEKLGTEIENNKELIEFGQEILNDLDYQISQNKILINKIKNTSLFTLNNNSHLNSNQINSNLILNEQLSPINQSISGTQTEEFNNKNLSNTHIINEYLKAISKFNIINKRISINYSNIIGFNFNSENNKLFKDIYNLLVYSFK